ncbi:SCAN domain-containing protein 3-like [Palaemon carinicauda]|uniref:SCAN domain-containing protein 3-like n=1 Tax=Palaemon carinicauda TaxID=392227 RepID=UPI0035B59117
MAKRSYKDAFLDFGFTNIVDHGIIKPQCVICCEVLSNESMKSNKLKRHLTSKHPQHALQERAFFERKEAALKRQRFETPDNPAVVALKQATLASYKVAWRISNKKAPHTIGEDLVKPAAIDMVKTVCGEDVARKLEIIPLSNDTVRRRIVDMSLDIKHQVVDHIKAKGAFSLQLDESTDCTEYSVVRAVMCRFRRRTQASPLPLKHQMAFKRKITTMTTGSSG